MSSISASAASSGRRPRRRAGGPERIRITKVGLWYVLFTVLVGIAAANTGNNALYIVLSVQLGLLVVSGVLSNINLRGLAVELTPPSEIFSNRPFSLGFSLHNASRGIPRYLLLLSAGAGGAPRLVPFLPRQGRSRGQLEMLLAQRGRHVLDWFHLASLFPLGFFHKGWRRPVGLELLVYPELFSAATRRPEQVGGSGDGEAPRLGWGHDLHSLRDFRRGDDPRGIHWKQTAKHGRMIYLERSAEDGRRLSIVFDNAAGELVDEAARARFERLVSEAATAAVDYLHRGFEVELRTRERHLPFAAGRRQRRAILETLALIGPLPTGGRPLVGAAGVAELRLSMLGEARAGISR